MLAAALSPSSRKTAFMVSSHFVALLTQVCHARDLGATPVGWATEDGIGSVAIVEQRRVR